MRTCHSWFSLASALRGAVTAGARAGDRWRAAFRNPSLLVFLASPFGQRGFLPAVRCSNLAGASPGALIGVARALGTRCELIDNQNFRLTIAGHGGGGSRRRSRCRWHSRSEPIPLAMQDGSDVAPRRASPVAFRAWLPERRPSCWLQTALRKSFGVRRSGKDWARR